MWQNGAVSQLPLPPGETLGDASSVNASTVAVGSVDAGISRRGVIYNGATRQSSYKQHRLEVFSLPRSGSTIQAGP
jgi:hypothetical protein